MSDWKAQLNADPVEEEKKKKEAEEAKIREARKKELDENPPALLEHVLLESKSGNLEPWIDSILRNKLQYDQQDSNGYTALHLSVWLNRHEDVLNLLNKASCPVDLRSKNMQTALSLAAAKGHLKILKLLLDRGADLESRDLCGMTPFLCAAHNGQIQSAIVLQHRGANIENADYNGSNAMHLAASKNHVNMMRMLKMWDFELETQNDQGFTPLHLAASHNSLDALEYLLMENVSKDPIDKKNRTPSALAIELEIEGPADFIANFSPLNTFYRYFFYFQATFWTTVYFVYYTYVFQDTLIHLFHSLIFNISISLVLPLFCVLKCIHSANIRANTEEAINKLIIENFEGEEFEEIPRDDKICYTCQIMRTDRSKHCKYTNKCVVEYDHFCKFIHKPVGKNNHKAFFCCLFLNFITAISFLLLMWRKLEKEVEYLCISQYVMGVVYNFAEVGVLEIGVTMLCCLVAWYTWWYLIMEAVCISKGSTVNEALNRHKYKYLFKYKEFSKVGYRIVYENPYDKGIFINWLDFLTN